MRSLLFLSAATAGLMSINMANAATATGTLNVQAVVVNGCAVNTDGSGSTENAVLNFGSVSSFNANVDADTGSSGGTSITVQCNNLVQWSMALDGGSNELATQRRMLGGISNTEYIPYNLYSDASRSTPITASTIAYNSTGTGAVEPLTIYGRIPFGTPTPSAGPYLDTVLLTLTY